MQTFEAQLEARSILHFLVPRLHRFVCVRPVTQDENVYLLATPGITMTPANTTRQIAGSKTKQTPEGVARIEPGIQNCPVFSTRALWLFLVTFLSGFISVQAGQMHTLSGHVPPAAALLQPLDSLAGSNRLHLAIGLPMRNQIALNSLLHDLYDPSSPAYHHFSRFMPNSRPAFGPTGNGLSNRSLTSPKQMDSQSCRPFSIGALVEVSGRVSDIENAFHVHMRRFQHPSEPRTFYAPDVEPSVDSSIPVQFIGGLANYQLPHPSLFHAVPLAKSNGLRSNWRHRDRLLREVITRGRISVALMPRA